MADFLAGDDVCPFSKRVDGPRHSWRFDGDDPYVECHYCGQVRSAQTDQIIRRGRTHQPELIDGTISAEGPNLEPHDRKDILAMLDRGDFG